MPTETTPAPPPLDTLDAGISGASPVGDPSGTAESTPAGHESVAPHEDASTAEDGGHPGSDVLNRGVLTSDVANSDGSNGNEFVASETSTENSVAEAIKRLEDSDRIPPHLRRRLLETARESTTRDGETAIGLDTLVGILETALPSQAAGQPARRTEHPHGEAFFAEDPGLLGEAEADRIAREQLAAAGFAPRASRIP